MIFEWDENKRERNLVKHGLDFSDAEVVFNDPNALSAPDNRYTDDRWQLIGKLEDTLIVLVAYTELNTETIRVISMRKATARERERYLHELAFHANDPLVHLIQQIEKERLLREVSEDLGKETE